MSGLAFLGAAAAIFLLWHFLPQRHSRPPQPKPRFRNDSRVTSDQEQWQAFVEAHCESPAETAFLRAMISAFDMRPQNGSLVADGVRLDFQVEEDRYRVDFLVNTWLVVEIDGAAYHSSPEAVARDQKRDRVFETLGYTVLRIPARLVFNRPALAVEQVKIALSVGKREIVPPAAIAETNGFFRLGQTVSSFTQAVHKINDGVGRSRAIAIALAQAERSTAMERTLVDQAITAARRTVELDDWLREDPQRAESYQKNHAKIKALFEPDRDRSVTFDRVPFLPPIFTGTPEIDVGIEAGFQRLVEERSLIHRSAKQTLDQDPRLRPLVHEMLTSFGWQDAWERIR